MPSDRDGRLRPPYRTTASGRDYPRIVVPPPGPKARARRRADAAFDVAVLHQGVSAGVARGARRNGRGRGRQPVPRFHGRDRGRLDRLRAPEGHRGDQGRRPTSFCTSAAPISITRAWRRSVERLAKLAPGPEQEARLSHELRHRGGRWRDQARAQFHAARGTDRVQGRVPRAHLRRHEPDLEQGEAARGLRPAAAGGLPRAVRESATAANADRRTPTVTCTAYRAIEEICSRGRSIRAMSRRSSSSRFRVRAATWCRRRRLPRRAPRALRQARHSARVRRDPVRRRPDGEDVGDPSSRGSSPTSCSRRKGSPPACRSARSSRRSRSRSGRTARTARRSAATRCAAPRRWRRSMSSSSELMPTRAAIGERLIGGDARAAAEASVDRRRARQGTHDRRRVREGSRDPRAGAGARARARDKRVRARGSCSSAAGKSTLRLAPPLVIDAQDIDTAARDHHECLTALV